MRHEIEYKFQKYISEIYGKKIKYDDMFCDNKLRKRKYKINNDIKEVLSSDTISNTFLLNNNNPKEILNEMTVHEKILNIFNLVFYNIHSSSKTLTNDPDLKMNKNGITYIPDGYLVSKPFNYFFKFIDKIYLNREKVSEALRKNRKQYKAKDLENLCYLIDYYIKRIKEEGIGKIEDGRIVIKPEFKLENPIIKYDYLDYNLFVNKEYSDCEIKIINKNNRLIDTREIYVHTSRYCILRHELEKREEEIIDKLNKRLEKAYKINQEINNMIKEKFYDYMVMNIL